MGIARTAGLVIASAALVLCAGGARKAAKPKPIPLPVGVRKNLTSVGTVLDRAYPDFRLVIAGWPEGNPVKGRTVRGSEFFLYIIARKTGRVVHEEFFSPCEPDVVVDFSGAAANVIRIDQLTSDPRQVKDVPFLRRTLTVTPNGDCRETRRVVLLPERATPRRIEELKKVVREELAKKGRTSDDRLDEAASHLRNISINDPQPMLRFFKSVHPLFTDGDACHGWVKQVEAELEMAKGLRRPSKRLAAVEEEAEAVAKRDFDGDKNGEQWSAQGQVARYGFDYMGLLRAAPSNPVAMRGFFLAGTCTDAAGTDQYCGDLSVLLKKVGEGAFLRRLNEVGSVERKEVLDGLAYDRGWGPPAVPQWRNFVREYPRLSRLVSRGRT